jgi:hypothetical protein
MLPSARCPCAENSKPVYAVASVMFHLAAGVNRVFMAEGEPIHRPTKTGPQANGR